MSAREDPAAAIARTVLYEGYVLWPYRRGALKNARRWTFGCVFPPRHAALHPDDPATMRTQLLVHGPGEAEVEVTVRFLQVIARQPLDAAGAPVDALEADGERHVAWEEARERELTLRTAVERPERAALEIAGGRAVESLAGGGEIARTWEPLKGSVSVRGEPLRADLHRLTVEIANATPFDGGARELALRRSLVSAHTLLRCPEARFVSPTDPPAELATAAATCASAGTWPVLVGDAHTVLSSPIVLPDHPAVAPESPGDLFDGGEIDGLLIAGVLSLGEAERREAAASDPRVRELLERCEGLEPAQLAQLHAGAVRERRPGGSW
jgi:hypothetical protein